MFEMFFFFWPASMLEAIAVSFFLFFFLFCVVEQTHHKKCTLKASRRPCFVSRAGSSSQAYFANVLSSQPPIISFSNRTLYAKSFHFRSSW